MSGAREHWGSRTGFILAAAGSAIGLGNIWKYPHMAGQHGGGAFTLVYLACIALVGLPILLAEFSIGRRTQLNPVGAFRSLAGTNAWKWVGFLGVASAFVILSFYSVIGGWTIKYAVLALTGTFGDFTLGGDASRQVFEAFIANPLQPIFWHLLFMGTCVYIISRGVKGGIERWSKILMPLLLGIILVLVIRGITLDGAMEGIRFLFQPKWSDLDPGGVVLALGHSFFTISLGMGTMITYGSYLRRDTSLVRAGLAVVLLDTAIALLAGIVIFTAVFAMGQDPAAGPSLIFIVLPTLFPQIPGGQVFAFLFFALFFMAALTSAISILEVVTAYFIDEKKWGRTRATLVFGGVIAVVGIFASLSLGGTNVIAIFGDLSFFDLLDKASSKYMLPIGGLLTAIFVLVRWGIPAFMDELGLGDSRLKLSPRLVSAIVMTATVLVGVVLLNEAFGFFG